MSPFYSLEKTMHNRQPPLHCLQSKPSPLHACGTTAIFYVCGTATTCWIWCCFYSDPSSETLMGVLGLWEVPRSQAGRTGHNLGLTARGKFATRQFRQFWMRLWLVESHCAKSKLNVCRGYTLVVICHLSKGRELHFCLLGSPTISFSSPSSHHTGP